MRALIFGRRLRWLVRAVVAICLVVIVLRLVFDPSATPLGPFSTPLSGSISFTVIALAGFAGYAIKLRARRTSLNQIIAQASARAGFRALLSESTYLSLEPHLSGTAGKLGALNEVNVVLTSAGLELYLPLSTTPQLKLWAIELAGITSVIDLKNTWPAEKHIFISTTEPPDLNLIVLRTALRDNQTTAGDFTTEIAHLRKQAS